VWTLPRSSSRPAAWPADRLVAGRRVHDLAIIVVSTNEANWLRPCLATVFGRQGDIDLDVVIADNGSRDGTRELVEREFPGARVVTCENRGFAHANNCALTTCNARFVLFLNPDTEIIAGTFAELVETLDARPDVGLAGVKQVTADGALWPTIRRFPTALRALGEALGSERWPVRARAFGERELDQTAYERETLCDWTSGSFMLVRWEAIESAGFMDERFFIYSEETDFCYRIKRAGWEIVHLPLMTIIHHAGKGGVNPKMEAQNAHARVQYARKNFSRFHRGMYEGALALRFAVRLLAPVGDRSTRAARRRASLRALRVLAGLDEPPFGIPPARAVAPRAGSPPVAPALEPARLPEGYGRALSPREPSGNSR
jgi:N-acetylglucosaminyl-diphospho-decaprenol L-rhamnosyltransferase